MEAHSERGADQDSRLFLSFMVCTIHFHFLCRKISNIFFSIKTCYGLPKIGIYILLLDLLIGEIHIYQNSPTKSVFLCIRILNFVRASVLLEKWKAVHLKHILYLINRHTVGAFDW